MAYAGASLPLLVLFVIGDDTLGTVATTEVVAVEVVRTLCGSVGLIAAVPLTTLLAAALAVEGTQATEAAGTPAGLASAAPAAGRTFYAPARRQTAADNRLLFDRVLAVHGSQLSHAEVGVADGSLMLERLPADARRAATQLQQLAATTPRRSGSWYRRALAAGRIRLDLHDHGQLDLLRRYGPFSTDTRVWTQDDPMPVIESSEALDGEPRATYRLGPDKLDRLRVALDEAGLSGATLVPRRARAHDGR